MIGIIDYGAGNLHSVLKAIKQLGYETKLITKASDHTDEITKLNPAWRWKCKSGYGCVESDRFK